MKTLAKNPKAKFDYEILDTYEAGLVLNGNEVKSIKSGRMSLKGAHVTVNQEEAWLINANIPPYQPANTSEQYDPTRSRKLLLHKKQIKNLMGRTQEKGLTLVPLRVYNKKNQIKLELALVKGKRKEDKREAIKEREDKRRIQRMMKDKNL